MKIVIGIISYLPDNEMVRETRGKLLKNLIRQCDYLFNIPILIIAQNWQNYKIDSPNVTVFHFPKLGITNARKELRKQFLETDNDYVIMLDDDCIVMGSYIDGEKYLTSIKSHKNGYGIKNGTLLKLAAFSRYVMQQVDFQNISPEKNEGHEDCIFCETIRAQFPQNEFLFTDNLCELSNSENDPLSVWRCNENKQLNRENTIKIVKKIRGENNYGKQTQ